MVKLFSAACVLTLLLTSPEKDAFSKYRAVQAYEIRPGILMFPRYAEDGQVCEVGLERRHYSPEKIALYSTLSRQEIDAIVDELVPENERGPRSESPLNGLITVTGHGMTSTTEYEKIAVQIYSAVIDASEKKSKVDDVAAVITWKGRKCK